MNTLLICRSSFTQTPVRVGKFCVLYLCTRAHFTSKFVVCGFWGLFALARAPPQLLAFIPNTNHELEQYPIIEVMIVLCIFFLTLFALVCFRLCSGTCFFCFGAITFDCFFLFALALLNDLTKTLLCLICCTKCVFSYLSVYRMGFNKHVYLFYQTANKIE